jgi:hypothetical protein
MSAPIPTPEEIHDAPELAILSALEHTLVLATQALLARHPCAVDLDDDDPLVVLTSDIINATATLRSLVGRYRLGLILARR